ncbi:hypothetical protein J2Y67_003548 [Neobacillus niacini]|nr:hypothetical protein [Neobacillus niacini]
MEKEKGDTSSRKFLKEKDKLKFSKKYLDKLRFHLDNI